MEVPKDKIKQFIRRDLDILRENYRRKFGELAVGKLMLDNFQEAMEVGDRVVDVHYSRYCVIREQVDKDFFKRLHWSPTNHYKQMFELLESQVNQEFQFRKEAVREYIRDLGLEANTEGIIEGMNRTAKRVTIWPDTSAIASGNPLRCWQVLQHDGKAMLDFALNYVDRWQMYNELFGNSS